ncbi:hypothetical protein [Inhella gelatinilytica]|uniref:Secreted protein n=1 Tax=Inhella gelatinilytica TaxID=2795030 RepID=A0A931IVA8_9BURK|nr:hypothetical protein [Inhella gelatinilytica]MBH9551654.1 hypothetical protein [Inhella gelatinilytica]
MSAPRMTLVRGLMAGLLTACAVAQTGSAALRAQLDRAVADPRCDADAQCRSVAMGHRACGGPESYGVYSLKVHNEAEVLRLAQQYRETRRAENQASGRVSTCVALPDPGARCEAVTQRCVLGTRPAQ